jgi:DNA processing protein
LHSTRAEKIQWVRLRQTPHLGPVYFLRLIRAFGSAEGVFNQSGESLSGAGIPRRVVESVCSESRHPANLEKAEKEVDQAGREGVQILLYTDSDYPINLKNVYAPPPYLYVKGSFQPEDTLAVSIVGTRRTSRDGLEIAGRLAQGLARQGICVVSGMARGVDSAAHRGVLEAGGRTIAVLGNGLKHCYPPENREIFEKTPESGALVSELPVETQPKPANFPARNRIIAGLSLGVIVVEAPSRSGALITARTAADQNREVFAVPGRVIGGRYEGCHQLIKEGARLVENEFDVIQCLADEIERIREQLSREEGLTAVEDQQTGDGLENNTPLLKDLPAATEPKKPVNLTEIEQKVWNILSEDPLHIDRVARSSGMDISEVSRVLLGLQLKNLVRQAAGMQFMKSA